MGDVVPIRSDSSVRTSRTTAFGPLRLDPLESPLEPPPDAVPASAEQMAMIAPASRSLFDDAPLEVTWLQLRVSAPILLPLRNMTPRIFASRSLREQA